MTTNRVGGCCFSFPLPIQHIWGFAYNDTDEQYKEYSHTYVKSVPS